jgi:quinol monooxygenase YgiN
MHIVLVHVHVKPDATDAFESASARNAAASRREPGVARFDVLRLKDDPSKYLLVEVYRTPEAAVAHKATAHYLEWRDAVAPFMAEPRTGVVWENVSPPDASWCCASSSRRRRRSSSAQARTARCPSVSHGWADACS